MKKIIRVFPRKTRATPDDPLVRFHLPTPKDSADEIHISVTFTYDLKQADYLFSQWKYVAPCYIGGPAYNSPCNSFTSGMYLKIGYTFTSRGCPNKCWFCSVPKREGKLIELPIVEGWNILDNNFLACSSNHIDAVLSMLSNQTHDISLTGGLDASLLTYDLAFKLKSIKPKTLYFAYDSPADFNILKQASEILHSVGFGHSHDLRCYILIGYKNDTFEKAISRIKDVISLGFFPMTMLFRDVSGLVDRTWRSFNSNWANPFKTYSMIKSSDYLIPNITFPLQLNF